MSELSNRHVTRQSRRTLLSIMNTVRAYLPPDGISKDQFIDRVIGAMDNPAINPVIAAFEHADAMIAQREKDESNG